jgi:hypothetical protein
VKEPKSSGLSVAKMAVLASLAPFLGLGAALAADYQATSKPLIVTADEGPSGGTHKTNPGVEEFGVNHDGVGDLIISEGAANYRCTGTLLTTGRHILTAAHCVTDGFGNVDADSVTATFNLAGGDVSGSSATIYVHPSYDGDTGHGYDVAIIEFDTEWVSSVPRYEMVSSGFDAIGMEGVSVGYGRTGYGATGSTDPSGTKRIGLNLWESEGLGSFGLGGVTNNGTQLTADFDNGIEANDAFDFFFGISDLGYGDDEIGLASGDSGGPTFFDEGGTMRIGGVASYVTTLTGSDGTSDVTPGVADSAFGEFFVVADVGDAGVQSWVYSTIGVVAVPEPGSAALLLIGTVVMAGRRRLRAGA